MDNNILMKNQTIYRFKYNLVVIDFMLKQIHSKEEKEIYEIVFKKCIK